MAKILIKNGRVWNGEKFFFADVLCRDKAIVRIAENITGNADFTFDAKNKIVSAGLVDIHVHMKDLSPDLYGIQAEMSSLPFGVTFVNDAGSVKGDKLRADCFGVKNTVFVGMDIEKNHISVPHTEKLIDKFGSKAVGIKVYFDKAVSELSDITPLKEACEYAKSKNLRVMVHCSNSPTSMVEIVNTLSCGDILTHIFHGGDNSCIEDDFAAFTLAKEKGIYMDAGFAGFAHTDFANMKKAFEAGYFPDTISTDITCFSAYKRGGRYGMTMCMSMAKECGMSEADIFRAVTSAPAKALGRESECGYLAEGKTADIAVFDFCDEGFDMTDNQGNNFKSNKGYRCVLTMFDGQIVYTH